MLTVSLILSWILILKCSFKWNRTRHLTVPTTRLRFPTTCCSIIQCCLLIPNRTCFTCCINCTPFYAHPFTENVLHHCSVCVAVTVTFPLMVDCFSTGCGQCKGSISSTSFILPVERIGVNTCTVLFQCLLSWTLTQICSHTHAHTDAAAGAAEANPRSSTPPLSPLLLIYRSQYVQASLFFPAGRLALTVNLYHQYSSIWQHENFIVESLRLKGLAS